MSKDKTKVVERLRARTTTETKIFVKKNLAISEQITTILRKKGWTQKELAVRLGKNESEISKMLSGLHNLTLKSIAKLEAILESEVIVTPTEASERYKKNDYVTIKVYGSIHKAKEEMACDYAEEESVEYQRTYQKMAI